MCIRDSCCDMVEVFPAIFLASIDVAPYSPIALAKASVTPDMIPGFAIGRRIDVYKRQVYYALCIFRYYY